MNQTPAEVAKTWLKNSQAEFELMFIQSVWNNVEFYKKYRDIVCRESMRKGFRWTDDFSTPRLFPIYRAISEFNDGCLQSELPSQGYQGIPMEIMRSFLNSYVAEGEMALQTEDVQTHMEVFAYILQRQPTGLDFMEWMTPVWLNRQKTADAVRRFSYDTDPERLTEGLTKAQNLVANAAPKKTVFHGFGVGIDTKVEAVERFATRIPRFDMALGGGFGRSESTMFIAATGCGKTVMATQLALMFVLQGRKGVLISTEESHIQLEPRIVSNYGNIPYDLIKDGITGAAMVKFNQDHMQAYQECRAKINNSNFLIHNWGEHRNLNIPAHLNGILEEAKAQLGGLDFFVFDWLGKGLDLSTVDDGEKLRLAMTKAASSVSDAARRYNVVAITFAQANGTSGKGYDNWCVDVGCIANSKQVADDMTNAIGISGIRDARNKKNLGSNVETYINEQSLYFAKARRSSGSRVNVSRQFNYQRFAWR